MPYPPSGAYLRWLSPLGNWEGWLFSGDYDHKTEATESTDLSTADGLAMLVVRQASIGPYHY
jgi:hypothetical protein